MILQIAGGFCNEEHGTHDSLKYGIAHVWSSVDIRVGLVDVCVKMMTEHVLWREGKDIVTLYLVIFIKSR